MLDSIFGKILAVFIAVLLISFIISGAVLYSFLGNYAASQKETLLKRTGDEIIELFQYLANDYDNYLVQRIFRKNLEVLSYRTNSQIWVVSKDGSIYFAYSPKGRQDATENSRLNENQTKDVMQGKEVRQIGNFNGFFKESYLTIEKPITINGTTVGAVYLHTPMPELKRIRTEVITLFVASATVSGLITILLAYIFSIKLTKPLKQINQAAKIIAGGEFQKRLDIKSRDEIGELAQTFNHMAHALENLEKMRRDFIANVSHEVRTPMTSIRGFIGGILDGTIPAERHNEYLQIVKDETERLNRLVNDLLDLSRIEAGEMKLNIKAFNINELLRRTVIKLENMISKKEIEVEANFETDEVFTLGDPDAIEGVLINLLHNAVKFTSEKGKIIISTENKKDKVHISVADTGIGIDPAEIGYIWDRFYKSDKSRSGEKSGTGLGLAIVKGIINQHGEQIRVESEPGKGTKFTFTLPKAQD